MEQTEATKASDLKIEDIVRVLFNQAEEKLKRVPTKEERDVMLDFFFTGAKLSQIVMNEIVEGVINGKA